jgi:hypothetical protein
MQHHTGYIPPILPTGNNSIEARVKALEVAQGYDIRMIAELQAENEALHQRIFKLSSKIDETKDRVAWWVICALVAAVSSLAMIVIKLKAPGLIQ